MKWRLDVTKRREVALGVLTLSMCATLVGWSATRLVLQQQVASKFDGRVREVQQLIRTRLELYFDALHGAKGLYAASKSVERDEFAQYFKATETIHQRPGLLAVDFVARVTVEQQPAFVERVRSDTSLDPLGYPEFAIHPATAEDAYVITYIEPAEGFQAFYGRNMGAEPVRRRMLNHARDTGKMAMTGRLTLQLEGSPGGFLLAVPIYRNGAPQTTAEERRQALSGFVVGIFDAQRFFQDMFHRINIERLDGQKGLRVQIFDREVVMFSTQRHAVYSAAEQILFDTHPNHIETVVEHQSLRMHALVAFPVADRAWSLHFVASPGFGLDVTQQHLPLMILISGSLLSLLLSGLVYVLVTSRTRATRLAEQMTSELRAKHAELLNHEQALDAELTEHKRLKNDISMKAEALGRTNAELIRREKVTQSLLEDLQTSKQQLEQQQHSLEEAHANLRRSHEEMLAMQLQLIQSEKLESIGRLAAGVAHEVKNPLAVILMGVAYLTRQMTHGDANVPMVLGEIELAVRKADTVIRGLLDFSAPSELQLNAEDLNGVIDQALLLVKHELEKTHVTVMRELSTLPPINLDGNKIQQVFINLFVNAVQAMPNGGTLTIRTCVKPKAAVETHLGLKETRWLARQSTVVVVEVDDTGSGIQDTKLPKVFDPFFTTKPTGKGTGLGLTVSKKIVELHGGLIDVRNRPEGGVRATIVFA